MKIRILLSAGVSHANGLVRSVFSKLFSRNSTGDVEDNIMSHFRQLRANWIAASKKKPSSGDASFCADFNAVAYIQSLSNTYRACGIYTSVCDHHYFDE